VGLDREPSYPSEPGGAIPAFHRVGALAAALDTVIGWLAPTPRLSRYVRVPDLRGLRMTRAWEPALTAGVKLRVHRLTERPAPVDGLVVEQSPPPHTRVRRGSFVTLTVLHPEHAPWNLSSS
jgi:beta-lactam-binding protein with PASTA domain